MFTWKLVYQHLTGKLDYQCLPGNWIINVYLETGLSMFIWKLVYQSLPGNLDYQCLLGNWFINVYLETCSW